MKLLTFITLFLLSTFAFGQTENSNSTRKFSFGINFSPDCAYRHLSANNNGDWLLEIRNDMESARFGFTSGFMAKYEFRPRFALESGLQFADKGDKHKFDSDDFVTIDPDKNDPSIPEKGKIKYHYYYLSVPLKVSYYWLQKDFNLFLSLGASADYFLAGRQKSIVHFSEETQRESNKIDGKVNPFGVVGLAGFGIEKNISQHLQFRLEPLFRYALTPLADGLLNEHLYSFGVNFTMFYR